MSKIVKVALKMTKLSVPEKINKSTQITNAILASPSVFISPTPTIVSIQAAIDDVEVAWNDASDGGKMKIALMHDKVTDLMKLLTLLAAYVENLANGDEEIIHLAGMEARQDISRTVGEFEVEHTDDRGGVRLRIKPRIKAAYRWEYRKDSEPNWTIDQTTVQYTHLIGALEEGVKYWFRVFYTGQFGEVLAANPVSIIVV